MSLHFCFFAVLTTVSRLLLFVTVTAAVAARWRAAATAAVVAGFTLHLYLQVVECKHLGMHEIE